MSKQRAEIDSGLADWLREQQVFFVATAPGAADGHLNLSPKGGDSLRILGPMEVAYQDYTGSGAETVAHLRENGRIILMFCAFAGPPQVARLHGRGTAILPGTPRYDELAARFPENPGTRALIHVAVGRVSTSCGFAVPFFDFRERRDQLDRFAAAKGPEKLREYRALKNRSSIDGLPAFD